MSRFGLVDSLLIGLAVSLLVTPAIIMADAFENDAGVAFAAADDQKLASAISPDASPRDPVAAAPTSPEKN